MSSRAALLALALAAAACGGEPASAPRGPAVRISSSTAEPEFGKAFSVAVEREWDAGDAPGAWSDAALAPLVVRESGTDSREARGRVLETRRFDARAFRSGPVRIPGPRFEAAPAGGGPARAAVADALDLRVRPSVDPARPGDPERPAALLPLPMPRGTRLAILVGAVLAAAAGLLAARRRFRPAPLPKSAGGAASAAAVALERLRALRSGGQDARAVVEGAATAVREFLEAGGGVRTSTRTSEEVLRSAGLPPAARTPLASLLAVADLVKFARAEPSPDDATRAVDDAEAAVAAAGGTA